MLVENLCRELRERGFETEIINVPFKWYPPEQILDSALIWRLMDLSESNGVKNDLIIATKFPTYVAKHSNKVTWLMHQHRMAYDLYDYLGDSKYNELRGTEAKENIRKKIIEIDNKTILESNAVYSISKNITQRLKHYNNISSNVLYHPPSNADKLYCNEFDDYIVSVGRLDPLKRVRLLVESLKYCSPSIKAYIAGKGVDFLELQRLAKECKVEDRVKFLGYVNDDDLLHLYANSFGVFFAPKDEDYGYITLEAFLSRKPVITCTDSGGVLEFVVDGVNGYVSSPEPEILGESIQRMWEDKNRCRSFGLEGYNKVKDISWDNVIRELTRYL